jgi:hypothetical protein
MTPPARPYLADFWSGLVLPTAYEEPPEVSEAMVTLAMIRLLLRRLAHPN